MCRRGGMADTTDSKSVPKGWRFESSRRYHNKSVIGSLEFSLMGFFYFIAKTSFIVSAEDTLELYSK